MTIDDKIRDEKLQYDIKKEAANISALSSDILQVKKILPFNQSRIIQQANLMYSPFGKALEKQTKKQVDTLNS